MTDISITAGSVLAGSNSQQERGFAGAAIAAGQAVYKDGATGRFLLADSNSATAAARTPYGIALNSAGDGQPLVVHKSGDLTAGATLVAGTTYYLSDTPGGICPLADVGSGEYACIVGIAKSTSVLAVAIQPSGVAL